MTSTPLTRAGSDDFWSALVDARHDLPVLLRLVAERVVEVLGDGCVLSTMSDDGTALVPQVVLHADPRVSAAMDATLRGSQVRVGEGVAGTVAADRRSVLLNDLPPATVEETTPARFLPFVHDHPMRAMMIVPLVAGGEVLGTLGSIRTSSDTHYTLADLRMLEGLAQQAAHALADAVAGPRAIDLADYEAIYRHNVDGVLITTPDGHILAANPAACDLLGRTEREIRQGGREAIVVPEDPRLAAALAERAATGRARSELLLRRGDGTTFPAAISSTIYTARDHKVRTVLIFRDVSADVEARDAARLHLDELSRAADRDPLTGLWNRRGFAIAASHALSDADRHGLAAQVVFLDVDGLKAINDAHGHAAGDRVIVGFAAALSRALRDVDVACRLGGDEFVFLAVDATPAQVDGVVERIDHELAAAELPWAITYSHGAAERPPRAGETLEELIDAADRDMYQQRVLRRLSREP